LKLPVGRESERILQRAWNVIPGGVNSARRRTRSPISVSSAQGSRVVDVDGREFIDFHAAYSAVVLGHSHPEVTEAVSHAIRSRVLLGLGVTDAEVELAERLVEYIPSAEQALLVNSGSEATYNAIRLARAVTGREMVLKFDGCYHGSHDYVLRDAETDQDESGGVFRAASDRILVADYNDLDGVGAAFRAHGPDIAAVIIEPIGHNPPNLLPHDGFLDGLRDICTASGALLIFDEVITGFRHHLGGYQAICGVTPDLTTVGKAMANGFPIAALVGRKSLMERFATHPNGNVFFAGTYNGNAVAVSAALATLNVLARADVHAHLFRLGERMRSGLQQLADDAGMTAVATGFGSIYTLMFTDTPPNSFAEAQRADADLFVRYREQLLARGIIEMPVPFVRAQVTYAHTDEDVDQALEAAGAALVAVL
jgi:glutamate-1-semialdehyde 2,1-aminomutase